MRQELKSIISKGFRVGNDWREVLCYIEEDLPLDDIVDVENFVKWIFNNGLAYSFDNADGLWDRFKDEVGLVDEEDRAQVPELPDSIEDILVEAPGKG